MDNVINENLLALIRGDDEYSVGIAPEMILCPRSGNLTSQNI